MRTPMILLGLTFLLVASLAPSANGYHWYTYNGHSYTLTTDWTSWAEAEAQAESLGGHLVTIEDDAENSWLTTTFRDTYTRWGSQEDVWSNIAWIGYYSNDNGSTWQWISGQSVTYFRHDYYHDAWNRWPQDGTRAYLHLAYHPYPTTWNAHDVHDTDYDANPKGIVEVDSIVDPAANVPADQRGDYAVQDNLRLTFVPNPSSAGVTIAFAWKEQSIESATVCDISGRKVRSLCIDPNTASAVFWDGRDDRGDEVAPGLYLCQLTSGAGTCTGKVILHR